MTGRKGRDVTRMRNRVGRWPPRRNSLTQPRGRTTSAPSWTASREAQSRRVRSGRALPLSLSPPPLKPPNPASLPYEPPNQISRTSVQVDFLRLLHAQLKELHRRYADHPVLRNHYPRPLFIVVVLYVDEEESVQRQMVRGQLAVRLKDAGIPGEGGEVKEVRVSDMDEETARRRFQASCVLRGLQRPLRLVPWRLLLLLLRSRDSVGRCRCLPPRSCSSSTTAPSCACATTSLST